MPKNTNLITPQEALDNYWDRIIPVNPNRIANKMDVNVIIDDSLTEIEGQFGYEGDDIPTIRIKPSEYSLRVRFTIAHELFETNKVTPQAVIKLMDKCKNYRSKCEAPKWKENIEMVVKQTVQELYS